MCVCVCARARVCVCVCVCACGYVHTMQSLTWSNTMVAQSSGFNNERNGKCFGMFLNRITSLKMYNHKRRDNGNKGILLNWVFFDVSLSSCFSYDAISLSSLFTNAFFHFILSSDNVVYSKLCMYVHYACVHVCIVVMCVCTDICYILHSIIVTIGDINGADVSDVHPTLMISCMHTVHAKYKYNKIRNLFLNLQLLF